MKNKWLWISNILVLVGFLILQSFWVQLRFSPIQDAQKELPFILFEFVIVLFGIIISVAGLAALLAIIPFRRRIYVQRFKALVPILTLCSLIFFFLIVAYSFYMVKNHGRGVSVNKDYNDIISPPFLDCSSIQNGKFKTDDLTIERTGSLQRQIDNKTRKTEEYTVEWKDCEYSLNSKVSSEELFVKITEVNKDYYKCYVTSNKDGNGPVTLYYLRIAD